MEKTITILRTVAGMVIALSILSLVIAFGYLVVIGMVCHRQLLYRAEVIWLTTTVVALMAGCVLKIIAHFREVLHFLNDTFS